MAGKLTGGLMSLAQKALKPSIAAGKQLVTAAKPLAAAAGKQIATTGSQVASAGKTGLLAAMRMGNTAARSGMAAGSAAAGKANQTLKFMGGVAPDKPHTVGSMLTAATSPNYPGLDRAVGVSKDIRKAVTARPFDRTRQAVGHALRYGNKATTAIAAPAVAYSAMYGTPEAVGDAIYGNTRNKEEVQGTRDRTQGFQAIPQLARVAWSAAGLSSHPTDREVGRQARNMVPQQLAYDLANLRKKKPGYSKTIDVLRSSTPAGAALTYGLNLLHREKPPQLSLPSFDTLRDIVKANPDDAVTKSVLDAYSGAVPQQLQTAHDRHIASPYPGYANSLGKVTGNALSGLLGFGSKLHQVTTDKQKADLRSRAADALHRRLLLAPGGEAIAKLKELGD